VYATFVRGMGLIWNRIHDTLLLLARRGYWLRSLQKLTNARCAYRFRIVVPWYDEYTILSFTDVHNRQTLQPKISGPGAQQDRTRRHRIL